jgi:hypothetical protein
MSSYVPPCGSWAHAAPDEAGMSGEALAAAAAFAQQHDSQWPYSLFLPDGRYIGNAYVGDKPPHDKPIGIVRPRGAPAGLVVRGGRIVAQWGDITRVDTTYSAAKSYVALMAGIAFDDGLIRSLDDHLADYIVDDGFTSEHNRAITWRHLLQPAGRIACRGQQPQGHAARTRTARHALGVQRRAGEPARAVPDAVVSPLAARRAARTRDGSDRCIVWLGMARL